jgi:NADH-quinone oxidoreductase subunit E
MFNLAPVGRYHVQMCGTTPCMLRGAGDLIKICHERIGEQFEVTPDGKLSWVEVECLGACVNAPMAQINFDFYEDLTPESFGRILDDLVAGRPVQPGPQIDRQLSAPVGGPTTLTDPTLYANGRRPGAGTHQHGGPAMADSSAKRPGEAGNQRDAGVPQPPVGDKSAESPPGSRRE